MHECVLSTQGWTDIQSCKERETERVVDGEEEEKGEEDGERGGALAGSLKPRHQSSLFFVFISSTTPL